MRYQEAEERPKLLEELGHRLQYYATIAGEFRNKVSGLKVPFFYHSVSLRLISWQRLQIPFQTSCSLLLYRSHIWHHKCFPVLKKILCSVSYLQLLDISGCFQAKKDILIKSEG